MRIRFEIAIVIKGIKDNTITRHFHRLIYVYINAMLTRKAKLLRIKT